MEKEDIRFLGYTAVAAALIIGIMVFGFFKDKDVAFARSVFSGLTRGEESVSKSIDWPIFKAMGQDIGAEYSKFFVENEKNYYRKAFIINFALSFQNAGGKLDAFANWRLYDKDAEYAVVAADTVGEKTALFTISKAGGKRKLVSIEWKGAK